jgi:superfamily II DNA/RNA helicase
LNSKEGERIICKTKAAVNKLAKKLSDLFIRCFARQFVQAGDRIMEQFREGHINILVQYLAARGIDVKISYVVNYHLQMCMKRMYVAEEPQGQDKGLSLRFYNRKK